MHKRQSWLAELYLHETATSSCASPCREREGSPGSWRSRLLSCEAPQQSFHSHSTGVIRMQKDDGSLRGQSTAAAVSQRRSWMLTWLIAVNSHSFKIATEVAFLWRPIQVPFNGLHVANIDSIEHCTVFTCSFHDAHRKCCVTLVFFPDLPDAALVEQA